MNLIFSQVQHFITTVVLNIKALINTVVQLFCLALLLFSTNTSASESIKHMEPPFWWAGMKNSQLQLMVHGDNINQFTPNISYKGVTLNQIIKVRNPNYLFLNLTLAMDVQPGRFNIHFQHNDNDDFVYSYSLLEREEGSANRKGFDSSDVIYLITPDRFSNANPNNDAVDSMLETVDRDNPSGRHGGDLQGMINSLDYLDKLGITAIWPNPLTENNQTQYSYHGYSSTDFYKVDARFGSNDDFKRFVSLAHKKGIAVIQDIILNHIGSNHWWMKDLPTSDWLNSKQNLPFTSHRRTTMQDPYAANIDRKQFAEAWFTDTMPDLNQRNGLLATYLIQNSIWWVEYAGLRGIREDTYSYADKTFLTHWGSRIMKEYPNFNIVGEEWSANPITVSYWQKGKKNSDGYVSETVSMMDFPLYYAMIESLSEKETWGNGLVKLYEMLSNDTIYSDPFNLVVFEGNHDTPRIFSLLDEDFDLYKMAMTYTLTIRGIPQLFYGSEILMTSPKKRADGIVRSDFPGGWKDDKSNAFTQKGLNKQQISAQNYLKKLLNWRKKSSVIHTGKLMHFAPKKGIYTYFRYNDKKTVMVILNKNQETSILDTSRFNEIITSKKIGIDVMSKKRYILNKEMKVPGRSALILEVK